MCVSSVYNVPLGVIQTNFDLTLTCNSCDRRLPNHGKVLKTLDALGVVEEPTSVVMSEIFIASVQAYVTANRTSEAIFSLFFHV